jgi:hypothetical protein
VFRWLGKDRDRVDPVGSRNRQDEVGPALTKVQRRWEKFTAADMSLPRLVTPELDNVQLIDKDSVHDGMRPQQSSGIILVG